MWENNAYRTEYRESADYGQTTLFKFEIFSCCSRGLVHILQTMEKEKNICTCIIELESNTDTALLVSKNIECKAELVLPTEANLGLFLRFGYFDKFLCSVKWHKFFRFKR